MGVCTRCAMDSDGEAVACIHGRDDEWEQAALDPKAIRAYDGPDGLYLLAEDLEAMLRDLAASARQTWKSPLSEVFYAPLLDRLADAINKMGEPA